MVVSTSDGEGNPLGAVVFYVFDEKYNFYFLSAVDSLHAKMQWRHIRYRS